MSRWLDIAAQADPVSISDPDTQRKPSKRSGRADGNALDSSKTPLMMVYDGCRGGKSNEGSKGKLDDMRHGFAVSGNPKTWTGNIVSLDEWRKLSDWQRHGPIGRVWCGACKTWVHECENFNKG